MALFTLRAKAKSDLIDIALYTDNKWGRDQRNHYLKQFDETFHALADSPSIGKRCNFIKQGYRKSPQGSHIIFYKEVLNSKIEIIRILHKNIDAHSLLSR